MHLHAGVLDAAVMFAYLLIFSFMWRQAAAKLHNNPLGQAMAATF